MTAPKVLIVTYLASPYQVELFDELARRGRIQIEVLYLYARCPHRKWRVPAMQHAHLVLREERRSNAEAMERMQAAQLVVFNYYQDPRVAEFLAGRARQGQPWVFWGERPGVLVSPVLGRFYRRWKLRWLHSERAPIWGIGKLAVQAYRAEFGDRREYVNLPYFSQLDRFATLVQRTVETRRTFVFSGSLIWRKGFDLLIRAFLQLASELPWVRLAVLGDGDLGPWAQAKTRRLGKRIEFLGFRDWGDLPGAYARGGILVAPSRYDGWGLVVPEGLAAGMPVITTDRMGAGVEFVNSRENGWRIEAGNGTQLYNAMREAARLTDSQYLQLSAKAKLSVAGHSLASGAARLEVAASAAMDGWRAHS